MVPPQPDAQSFSKFLATLGVFLCFAAIAGPALLIRDTAVLEIPAANIAKLTPVAQSEIKRRQDSSASAAKAARAIGYGSFVVGLGLTVLGLLGLRTQEQRQNEREKHELAELKEATPLERENFVRASVVDLDDADSTPEQIDSAVEEKLSVTDRVMTRLEHVVPTGYRFRKAVKLPRPAHSGSEPMYVDGFYEAKRGDSADIIVGTVSGYHPGKDHAGQAVAMLRSYAEQHTENTGREARSWLIMVAPEGEDLPPRLRELEAENPEQSATGPMATAVRFEEINRLTPTWPSGQSL